MLAREQECSTLNEPGLLDRFAVNHHLAEASRLPTAPFAEMLLTSWCEYVSAQPAVEY